MGNYGPPEVIKQDNPIMMVRMNNDTTEWLCMRPCPNCKHKLSTDGRTFWCVKCGWSEKPTEHKKDSLGKKWTKEEDKWLIKNFAHKTKVELSIKLNRTYSAIRIRSMYLRSKGIDVEYRKRGMP